jgi:glycosyltransferase involved in cell wall biosynthesis
VSESLSAWISNSLHVPESRVRYVPNFVCKAENGTAIANLPGHAGKRIVCVAGIRPEKDLINLIQAMRQVVDQVPDAHLLLVGPVISPVYFQKLQELVRSCRLENNITWLGERKDICSILSACDIGVLSSASEGFPVVLLEYGLARLGVVSTKVGQCGEVLDGGAAGLLIPPGDSPALSSALLSLLASEERRRSLGELLGCRVQCRYSAEVVLKLVENIYADAIAAKRN